WRTALARGPGSGTHSSAGDYAERKRSGSARAFLNRELAARRSQPRRRGARLRQAGRRIWNAAGGHRAQSRAQSRGGGELDALVGSASASSELANPELAFGRSRESSARVKSPGGAIARGGNCVAAQCHGSRCRTARDAAAWNRPLAAQARWGINCYFGGN